MLIDYSDFFFSFLCCYFSVVSSCGLCQSTNLNNSQQLMCLQENDVSIFSTVSNESNENTSIV